MCEMVQVKDPLLLIEKSCLCSGSNGFPILSASVTKAVVYIILCVGWCR